MRASGAACCQATWRFRRARKSRAIADALVPFINFLCRSARKGSIFDWKISSSSEFLEVHSASVAFLKTLAASRKWLLSLFSSAIDGPAPNVISSFARVVVALI